MHPYAIIRAEKLKTIGNVSASGSHNYRERPVPNAHADRLEANEHAPGAKTSAQLVDAVKRRIEAPGVHRRKDSVACLEYFVGASPEWFEGRSAKEERAYFTEALRFLVERHGKANIVGATIHRDERTPHLVVYAVPLVEQAAKTRKRSVPAPGGGRNTIEEQQPAQTWLSAGHFQGSRDKLRELQTTFAERVGARHGLARGVKGSPAKHERVKRFYGAMDAMESSQARAAANARVQAEADALRVLDQARVDAKQIRAKGEIDAQQQRAAAAALYDAMTAEEKERARIRVELELKRQAEGKAKLEKEQREASAPVRKSILPTPKPK